MPVIILSNYDNAVGAIDAVREGAYNYLIKFSNYHQIINLVIKEAINKSNEKMQMKETIHDLKNRVSELEERLGEAAKDDAEESSSEISESGIIDEITASLKRGEINLPSLPKIGIEFKAMLDKGADFQEVADLLKQDMAISSKLISVSNSAHFRGVVPNKTTEQAVSRLGLSLTKQYVDAIFNRALYTTSNKKYVDIMEQLWKHALSCGFACQCVAETLGLTLKDDAFSIGLLHDIGKLLLLQIISELEIKGKFSDEINMDELIQTLSIYNGKFGASLLRRWEFSEQCVHVAQFCENLGAADPISKELLVVHFANLLVGSVGYDLTPKEIDLETAESSRLLGLDGTMISELKDRIKSWMQGELPQCFA